jgi:hypothetical protein
MKKGWIAVLVAGIGIAIAITLFSPWASSHPDGLERVAEDEQFLDEGEDAPYEVIPDYTFPGVEDERLATVLSGIIGVVIVAGIALVVGLVLRIVARNRASAGREPPSPETMR